MKKTILKFLILCLVIIPFAAQPITGCGNDDHNENRNEEAKEVFDSTTGNNSKSAREVDIDLSIMSRTMIFAEVNNITSNPESYLGKSIRLKGSYFAAYYDVTDDYYHFVLIEDADSCCQQGLEFILGDDYIFPGDFPPDMTEIEITGIYSSYLESGQTYYYIAADVMQYTEE